MVGIPYSAPITASGGVGPYGFLLTSAAPAGLSLGSDGTLAGTPTTAASPGVTVQITDSLDQVTSQTCSFTVLPRLLVTTASVPQPTLATSYAVVLAAVGGGTSPRTWTKISGTLPAGVALSTAGRLAGTPTRTGRFVVGVQVRTADGFTAARTLTIIVATRVAITTRPALPTAHRGRTYAVRLAATGGYGTRSWSRASGALPTGLRLSSSGLISGKATKSGTYVVTVRVRDTAGRSTTRRLTLVVRY
jgi:hypothetical protein